MAKPNKTPTADLAIGDNGEIALVPSVQREAAIKKSVLKRLGASAGVSPKASAQVETPLERLANAVDPQDPEPRPNRVVVDLHAPLGPHGEFPLVRTRPRELDGSSYIETRLKVPSVVVRLDGRYGVARPRRSDETPVRDRPSAEHELVHEWVTYPTRAEAERRAWALARELGRTEDWP